MPEIFLRVLSLLLLSVLALGATWPLAAQARRRAEPPGGLDKSVIDDKIREHLPQIRHCYEKELVSAKSLDSGKVVVRFVIGAKGKVTKAEQKSSTFEEKRIGKCVVGAVKRIVFPKPLGGGVVEVDYPFAFTPNLELPKASQEPSK